MVDSDLLLIIMVMVILTIPLSTIMLKATDLSSAFEYLLRELMTLWNSRSSSKCLNGCKEKKLVVGASFPLNMISLFCNSIAPWKRLDPRIGADVMEPPSRIENLSETQLIEAQICFSV